MNKKERLDRKSRNFESEDYKWWAHNKDEPQTKEINKITLFAAPVILAGPKTNLQSMYNFLKFAGVLPCRSNGDYFGVLLCKNLTKIKQEHQMVFEKMRATDPSAIIPLEWFQTTPSVYWQSRAWWDYYFNVKYNRKPSIVTLNVARQADKFFNDFCIIE